jgi:uncharacterized protein YndB with AHSA1/START domain
MSERSVAHATFVIERDYPAAPARVFQAFSDPEAKRQWFGGPGETRGQMDFRTGGRDVASGTFPDGTTHRFDALYYDIVPGERIVFSYDMHIDQRRISVSLATVEITPQGSGSRLTFTEQGVFLDGYDDAGSRERGTIELLDALGGFLSRAD